MLSKDSSLDQIKTFFARDRFATGAGCFVVSASYGQAVCALELNESHQNVLGKIMGGALFTLADFALAVACNLGEKPTVSIDSSISFFRATKGKKLTAEAHCDKFGTKVAFYTVNITDDEERLIARMTATCYR